MTKKKIILLVFLMPLFVYGQKIVGGVIAGVNATQVSGDNAAGYNKAGILAGVFASTNFTDRSGFRMELLYSQKGSRVNPTDENPKQYLFRVNYIELPFIYRYHYNQKLIFETGLSFAYLLNHYEESYYSTEVYSTEFNNYAFNFIAGIAYQLSDRWSADFRTVNGINPIRPSPVEVKRFFSSGQYNDVLTLSINYHFGHNAR